MKREPQWPPAAGYLLIGITAFCWGTAFPAIKLAIQELPIWWFRGGCLLIPGMTLLLGAMATGRSIRVARQELFPLLACSTTSIVAYQLFCAYGVLWMPAGRASIIAFTMPIWVGLLAHLMLDEPLTRSKVLASILGVVGFTVLMGADIADLGKAPYGALSTLAAAWSWALGTVLFKRQTWKLPLISLTGWMQCSAAIVLLLVAALTEPLPAFAALSAKTYAAVIYLMIFSMLVAWWAFMKAVQLLPAAIASLGLLIAPFIGVYSSALVLGEPVGWPEFFGLILVSSAILVVFYPQMKTQS